MSLFFLPSLFQIICSSISFKWLGQCGMRAEADTLRQSQTETKHLHVLRGGVARWADRECQSMTSSRCKKAADQARWVLPDRWSTLITHCLGGRHLSDKWEAQCCLNLWTSRRLGQALWQQQEETKKSELQLQLGKDVNNLRVPDMWQARHLSKSHCQFTF